MNTPRGLMIQSALVKILKKITKANGYSHDVTRVIQKYIPHPDVEDPVLMVLRGGWTNRWDEESMDLIIVEPQFFVVCHYRADLDDEDEAGLNSVGAKLEDCVKTAIEANQVELLELADAQSVMVELGEPLTSIDAVKATFQVMISFTYLEKVGEQLEP